MTGYIDLSECKCKYADGLLTIYSCKEKEESFQILCSRDVAISITEKLAQVLKDSSDMEFKIGGYSVEISDDALHISKLFESALPRNYVFRDASDNKKFDVTLSTYKASSISRKDYVVEKMTDPLNVIAKYFPDSRLQKLPIDLAWDWLVNQHIYPEGYIDMCEASVANGWSFYDVHNRANYDDFNTWLKSVKDNYGFVLGMLPEDC